TRVQAGERRQDPMIANRAVGIVERISVVVHAGDAISRMGVVSQLRGHPALRIVDAADESDDTVALVVTDEMDEDAARAIRSLRGLTMSGLTEREIKVLKLLAEGMDTAEVGRELFYSERTVKNILHDVTSRLNLRNRTHAVAYALRQGLI